MASSALTSAIAAIAIFLASTSFSLAAEFQVGQEVLWRAGVLVEFDSKQTSVDAVPWTFRIDQMDDEWLFVGPVKIRRADAVPVEVAPMYYSDLPNLRSMPAALRARGCAWDRLGEYQKAIDEYTAAIGVDPTYASAYFDRGFAYLALGQSDAAVENCEEAVRLQPKRAWFQLGLGHVWLLRNNAPRAIRCYDATIRLDSRFAAVAWLNRGIAHAKWDEFEAAIKDFNEALRIDADYADAYLHRGRMWPAVEQPDKSSADFQRAIAGYTAALAVQPQNPFAYFGRGTAYLHLDRRIEAANDFNRAEQIAPGFDEADKRGFLELRVLDFNGGLPLKSRKYPIELWRGCLR